MGRVIVVGAGVAGMTSALYLSRFGHEVVVFGNYSHGALEQTPLIENFPGFPNGISGELLLEKMKQQAERFGTIFRDEEIVKINSTTYTVEADDGKIYYYDVLIVATGSTPRKLSIPGDFHYCALCDGMLYQDKKVMVVGGGDSALTEALHLSGICSEVTLLYRKTVRATRFLREKCMSTENIIFQRGELKKFEDGIATIEEAEDSINIPVDGIFVSIGNVPNDSLVKNEFGKVFERKNNVFMCGDCINNKYRQAVIAAGSGAITAVDVDNYLKFSTI